MGGLRATMPFTHATFLIGTLALVGHPDLRGLLVEGRDPRLALAEGGALGWTSTSAGCSARC